MMITSFTAISSYIFNLTTLTFFALGVGWLLLKAKPNEGESYPKTSLYNWFMWLGAFAILTQVSYVFAPKRVYTNADHHLIEHLGFSFTNELPLVDERQPARSLWDTKTGELTLRLSADQQSFRLQGRSFYEPIYRKEAQNYQLANPVIKTPVSQKLAIQLHDTVGVEFRIGAKEGLYSFVTNLHGKQYGPFVIPITKPLQTGYSVGGLLNKVPADAPGLAQLITALDSVWLVRQQVRSGDENNPDNNPLLLFPSASLVEMNPRVSIDNQMVDLPADYQLDVSLAPKQAFYFGLWNTQTKTYFARCTNPGAGTCEWLMTFPNKKYLKKLAQPQESLFLTSSADEVAHNEQVAGFYYPWMHQEDNQNQFSATLTYADGSTQEAMRFKVVDLNQNDLADGKPTTYLAGDTIRIESRSVGQADASPQWLFRISDVKANNPLQFWHMIGFTVWLVLLVFISISLTPFLKQTKTEYIAYILLITLMTIRSVLLWRASTFLPTEEISESVYAKLANGGFTYFRNGVLSATVFFILVWLWKLYGDAVATYLVEKRFFRPIAVGEQKPLVYVLVGCVTGYAGAKILVTVLPSLERIGAIYLPLLVYFTVELWFLYQLYQNRQSSLRHSGYRWIAAINWLFCFGYLAVSDAGFSIVFFICTMLYWLLQLLTFPDHLANQTGPAWWRSLRHWRFVVPLLLLITFVVASPYLISFVFQRTEFVLMLIAVGLVVLGLIFAFVRLPFSFFNRMPVKAAGTFLFIALAGILFVSRGPISEKVQDKRYVRYRAEVLILSPDQIIQNENFQFNLGNDSKLLRAAQNQWFINYFYERGGSGYIKPFLNLVTGNYFQLLPSFQKGSPYLTQISDLVTVRYVIGEHSQLIILNVLVLMIFLLMSAIDRDTRFNFFSKLRVQLLCLLFTVGLFIWMAATNRIVFLGQDFPLLSLNSWLTLFFTFSILWVAIAFGQQANRQQVSDTFNAFGKTIAQRLFRVVLSVAIILLFFRQHDFSETHFNLDTTIERLRDDFDSLNERFAYFQNEQQQPNQALPTLLADFNTSIRDHDLFKTPFSRSAYMAYLNVLAKDNSPEHLIHVRRGTDGIYEFAINKLFYDVVSPDVYTQAWQGSLVSGQTDQAFSIQNRESNQEYALNPQQPNADLERTLGKQNLIQPQANQNIRLTVLPAGWSPDSLPMLMISSTQGVQQSNRSQFVIKNGGDVFRSASTADAFILKPDDVIQFISAGNGKPISLQYRHKSNLYLAKNVWLNGRYQFFYPLRHKFLWSHHFANLVKSKFDKEPDKQKQNLSLTLDPVLTGQIYDQAEAYFRPNKWMKKDAPSERARAFNLVVLGSDGGIRALCDFKKGAPFIVDPNRMSDYEETFNEQYLDAQASQERLLFGNRCLMRMDNGPASTFKPILYSAVTSQYNFDWPALEFGGLPIVLKSGFLERINNDDYYVRRFGGKPVKFALGGNNLGAHNMDYYIRQSTNSYNSMVVFLGSLDKAQISRVKQYTDGLTNDTTFLARGLSPRQEKNFPILSIHHQPYRINATPGNWANYNSLMAKGLWENFNLPVRAEELENQEGSNLQNLAYDLDSVGFAASRSSNKLWSFPEPSHLYLIDRNNLHNAIVQCATGADPINVTPYKMAEMAASLFSFNKHFKGSVLAQATLPYRPLSADNTWQGADQLTTFYSQSLFNAMHHALLPGSPGGTAVNLVGPLLKEFPTLHFYAKTGTISGNRFGGKRDKHLMLIISRDQLHGRSLTPQDLRNNRFFVLYFSFYKQSNSSEWYTPNEYDSFPLKQMIRTVINSNSFKNFMR